MGDVIDDILRREGSAFTNDPDDRGGATKYGITQRAWGAYLAKRRLPMFNLERLDELDARAFYRNEYVEPLSWIVDTKLQRLVIDCAVNHSMKRAVQWVQSALGVAVDGVAGPATRAALATPTVFGEYSKQQQVYADVLRTRFRFYAQIATDQANDPDAKFLRGWISRACEFIR